MQVKVKRNWREIFRNWLDKNFLNWKLYWVAEREKGDQPFLRTEHNFKGCTFTNAQKAKMEVKVKWIGWASILTLARLPLGIVFCCLWLTGDSFWQQAAIMIFAIAASTDALDGAVARKTKTKTEAGAILDQYVDKIFAPICLITLIIDGSFVSALAPRALAAGVLTMIIMREMIWLSWRLIYRHLTNKRLESKLSGKLHTWFLGILTGQVMLMSWLMRFQPVMGRLWIESLRALLMIVICFGVWTCWATFIDLRRDARKLFSAK